VLQQVIIDMLVDHADLVKQLGDNAAFKRWLADTIFEATYQHVTS
jgi:type I restriction enzyme, R subunit